LDFTLQTCIDLPRSTVIELHYCWENLALWWKDFRSVEHIDGEDGSDGSTYRCTASFSGNIREYKLTILKNELPEAFEQLVRFEDFQIEQRMLATFKILGAYKTEWNVRHTLSGEGVRHLQLTSFQQQMFSQMSAFKDFAEKQVEQR